METEGHVLRSLSVGHTARNQNFVSIGHLRVENFAAGVDVEALHDRIGRQLDLSLIHISESTSCSRSGP